MTDKRLKKVARVKHLKQSLQEQAEWQLANALTELRQLEASVAEVEQRKEAFRNTATDLTVAHLQNRVVYGDLLKTQLNRQLAALNTVQLEVTRQRQEVQAAYTETNRWTTLEELHTARLVKEVTHREQSLADELAMQRHASPRRDT